MTSDDPAVRSLTLRCQRLERTSQTLQATVALLGATTVVLLSLGQGRTSLPNGDFDVVTARKFQLQYGGKTLVEIYPREAKGASPGAIMLFKDSEGRERIRLCVDDEDSQTGLYCRDAKQLTISLGYHGNGNNHKAPHLELLGPDNAPRYRVQPEGVIPYVP